MEVEVSQLKRQGNTPMVGDVSVEALNKKISNLEASLVESYAVKNKLEERSFAERKAHDSLRIEIHKFLQSISGVLSDMFDIQVPVVSVDRLEESANSLGEILNEVLQNQAGKSTTIKNISKRLQEEIKTHSNTRFTLSELESKLSVVFSQMTGASLESSAIQSSDVFLNMIDGWVSEKNKLVNEVSALKETISISMNDQKAWFIDQMSLLKENINLLSKNSASPNTLNHVCDGCKDYFEHLMRANSIEIAKTRVASLESCFDKMPYKFKEFKPCLCKDRVAQLEAEVAQLSALQHSRLEIARSDAFIESIFDEKVESSFQPTSTKDLAILDQFQNCFNSVLKIPQQLILHTSEMGGDAPVSFPAVLLADIVGSINPLGIDNLPYINLKFESTVNEIVNVIQRKVNSIYAKYHEIKLGALAPKAVSSNSVSAVESSESICNSLEVLGHSMMKIFNERDSAWTEISHVHLEWVDLQKDLDLLNDQLVALDLSPLPRPRLSFNGRENSGSEISASQLLSQLSEIQEKIKNSEFIATKLKRVEYEYESKSSEWKNERDCLEREVEVFKSKIATLEIEVAKSKYQVDSTKNSVTSVQLNESKLITEIVELRAVVASRERENLEKLQKLTVQFANLKVSSEKGENEYLVSCEKILLLEQLLLDIQSDLDRQVAINKELDVQNKYLKEESRICNKKFAFLSEQILGMQLTVEDLKYDIEEAHISRDLAEEKLKQALKDINNMNTTSEYQFANFEDLSFSLDEKQSQISELEKSIAILKDELKNSAGESLKILLTDKESKIEELENELSLLNKAVSGGSCAEEIIQLQLRIKSLVEEKKSLARAFEDADIVKSKLEVINGRLLSENLILSEKNRILEFEI